jgi:hypothetical protein
MTLEQEQSKFDAVKWFDSISAGEDKCGSYEFCGECNKNISSPCARAARRYARGGFRVATLIIKIRGKENV